MQQPSQGSGFCTSCGAKLNPNVKFCTKCGATAGAPAATSIPKPASMPAFVHPTPQAVAPSLLRMKNNEKIEIEGSEFLIGKKQEMVNYCISDNPAVSRVHAKIIQRNGQYFIMDMGSTNHTYVNGIKVSANIETPIRNNSKIRISNEEFIFHA
jgi:pSer/pThr/pTyr-binding forkhead associated (FHA) protein